MKAIMMSIRLWWFYLTYKGIKTTEIRKRFAKNFKGKIFECVSKTNWKKDLMKIPAEEREFFKQFVGKVGLCFECDKVEEINKITMYSRPYDLFETKTLQPTELLKQSCLRATEMTKYFMFSNLPKESAAIHITKVEPFDKPKEISEFLKVGCEEYFTKHVFIDHPNFRPIYESELKQFKLTRAPQSYCFIEV